jgi:hypothetical protein
VGAALRFANGQKPFGPEGGRTERPVTSTSLSKGMLMANKHLLVVNVLFWVVGALLYPLAGLVPTG